MPRRRIGAIVAALSLGALTALAVPTAASAHTGTLSATSVCAPDGTRLITYTGSTVNVPASGNGHVATLTVTEVAPSDSTVSPATQTVTGDTSYSFTQTVPGDTTNAGATASIAWGDGAASDPRGVVTFDTGCTATPPAQNDALAAAASTPATCTTSGTVDFTIENATWDDAADTTDGSRTATATAGHLFADGTSTATVTYTVEPQLDQNAPPCVTLDATASAQAKDDASCATSGTADFTIENATWDDAADTTDGSRTATATAGHLFADGTSTATVTYALEPQLDPHSAACVPEATPSVTHTTVIDCRSTDAVVTTTTTTPTYTLSGTTWVRGDDTVTTTQTTRPLTTAEKKTCPTVVVEPPTDNPPTTTPPTTVSVPPVSVPPATTTTSATGELAYTGVNDDTPYVALGALLAMLAGAGALIAARMKARRRG